MTEYAVRLGTPEGAVVEQRHRAMSEDALRRDLEGKGFTVFRVRERRGALRLPFVGRRERLGSLEFLVFNQQLATLLKAGIPILQSLELLQRTQSTAYFREVLSRVLEDVKSGVSLSDAFGAQGGVFPKLYCATVLAGERAGELVSVLHRYIHHQQMLEGVRRRVKSALTYPIVLLSLSFALIVVLVTYVIPRFATFYLGFSADLPLITKVLVGGSTFIQKNLVYIIGGILIAYLLARRWLRSESGLTAIDHGKLKVPFVGRVFHLFGLSQFVRSLGTLIAGGTPLVNALEIASGTVTNRAIGAPLVRVAGRVREGQPLSASLRASGLVPPLAVDMIEVGESTGALPAMLNSVAEFFEEDVNTGMQATLSLIEPAIMIFMGGFVAFVLISLYLPIFSLADSIR